MSVDDFGERSSPDTAGSRTTSFPSAPFSFKALPPTTEVHDWVKAWEAPAEECSALAVDPDYSPYLHGNVYASMFPINLDDGSAGFVFQKQIDPPRTSEEMDEILKDIKENVEIWRELDEDAAAHPMAHDVLRREIDDLADAFRGIPHALLSPIRIYQGTCFTCNWADRCWDIIGSSPTEITKHHCTRHPHFVAGGGGRAAETDEVECRFPRCSAHLPLADLPEHIATAHYKSGRVECRMCGKNFSGEAKYVDHVYDECEHIPKELLLAPQDMPRKRRRVQ
ncbi:hypothetical protein B0H10DRAFT_2208361 [Mycena sp. CBHHK59/15]|nr:hypothetical protein B0H10DRAFT_2208361 [Mycena sp. CBHHK59/15]